MKDSVDKIFKKCPDLESFGCEACRFHINGYPVPLNFKVQKDSDKIFLLEVGISENTCQIVTAFVLENRKVFIEEDTLILNRKDFV